MKKSLYSLWSIIYFSFIFLFTSTIILGYKFYYNTNIKNIFLISLFSCILFLISFFKINNITKKLKDKEEEFEYSDNEETSDNEEISDEEDDESYDEEINDILNCEDIIYRWKFYKKICFYELLRIKNKILSNPLNNNFYFKFLKYELNKITLNDKKISNYKNELHMIIYYLTTEYELNYMYQPVIKPLKAIYKLC